MIGRLDGKVAFVTGGARGQGRAIAAKLAGEGADLVIADIGRGIDELEYSLASDADAQETVELVEAAGRRCLALVADVRDQAALDRAVAEGIDAFETIDVLVANAGIIDYKPFWEISDEEWETILGVNLTGVWQMRRERLGAVDHRARLPLPDSTAFTRTP